MAVGVLRDMLGGDIKYDFLQGAHPWPAASGVVEIFDRHQVYYSYLDGTPQSTINAVNDLFEYASEFGTFDAVIGFSLGAALAATLLLRQPEQMKGPMHFKIAIFISGTLPGDWKLMKKDSMALVQASSVKHQIQIPTIHIWNPEDHEYPGQSDELLQMCARANRGKLRHSTRHGVPDKRMRR